MSKEMTPYKGKTKDFTLFRLCVRLGNIGKIGRQLSNVEKDILVNGSLIEKYGHSIEEEVKDASDLITHLIKLVVADQNKKSKAKRTA